MNGRPQLLRAVEVSEAILTALGRLALEQDRRRVPALSLRALGTLPELRRAFLLLERIDGFVRRSAGVMLGNDDKPFSAEDWIELTDDGLKELRRRASPREHERRRQSSEPAAREGR